MERTSLIFYVNGKKIEELDPDPEWTLIYYLRRKLKLCGTKMGCGDGGCGACTVMISKYDHNTKKPIHLAINACLAPVCSMHGLAVTTVEGIGSTKTRLHPVQERIAKAHGSQCGFCTPGIVMSMYALLRSMPKPRFEDLELAFQGNLCRCTGYRPILEGYKTFTEEWESNRITQNTTKGCPMGEACCKNSKNLAEPNNAFEPSEFIPYDSSQEPIFPSELALTSKYDSESIMFKGKNVTWYRPTSLEDLLKLKRDHNYARIVTGNTEVGVEVKFKKFTYPVTMVIISPTRIKELNEIVVTDTGVTVGASVTLTDLETKLKSLVESLPSYKSKIFKSIVEMLHWFAGKQIRNVGSVGGNIMTGSPISDLNPIFMAANVELHLKSDKDERKVKMDENFFTGYRKNLVRPDEILLSINIPFTNSNQYFKTYKQAKRREDDIAIVNMAMNVQLTKESKIENIILAYGGMAPVTKIPLKTCNALKGLCWNDSMLEIAYKHLLDEFNLHASAPGGMIRYRHTLTLSLFFKLYVDVLNDMSIQLNNKNTLNEKDMSAFNEFEKHSLKSSQYFSIPSEQQSKLDPVGRPMLHSSGIKHATGEAVYCDDMPMLEDELYLAPLLSSEAHAKLLSIDASDALELEGVVAFYSAKDVDPNYRFGAIINDDEVFISEKVTSQGQLLGAIVAIDQATAQKAITLIKVEYEEIKPICITIEDAIEQKSYFPDHPIILTRGNIEESFKTADLIVENEFRVGGQEHFYLETQVARAVPKGEDNELEIFCATQHPSYINTIVSRLLGIDINKIVTRVKRIGGGFGGKETNPSILALPVALAAHRLQKPVRCMLDREEDMQMTGHRHPFLFKYRIGVKNDGTIVGAYFTMYANAGHSMDVSPAALERAMLHCDNAYFIPNLHIEGYLCKTNMPSNTAFRGTGGPQVMLLAENYIREIALKLNMDYVDVMKKNFYVEGQMTHYNQQLSHCMLNRCWDECWDQSNYAERLKEVEIFNSKNKWKKRGISIVPTKFGVAFSAKHLNQAGALLHVYTDGSVLLSHGGCEMGQGLHTKMLQVASKELNIDVSKIHISETATDKVPNTSPTAASVSSDLNGMAVLKACKIIMERLKPVIEKNPGGKWEDWISQAYLDCISLSAVGHYNTPIDGYDLKTNTGTPYNYFAYGAACSEVEVDCLTGDHFVRRTDIVMDVGESINPAIDIGQVEGAFLHGYGLYTMEELIYGPYGRLLSRGPGTYKIPGFSDIPKEFNVSLLKGAPNPRAIYSSKAVGEPPLFLASSIFFAIKEAITAYRVENGAGKLFKLDSPASCERIRMACQDSIIDRVKDVNDPGCWPWNVVP